MSTKTTTKDEDDTEPPVAKKEKSKKWDDCSEKEKVERLRDVLNGWRGDLEPLH